MNSATAILLPTALLVVSGNISGMTQPGPQWGGLPFVEYFAPSTVVTTAAVPA